MARKESQVKITHEIVRQASGRVVTIDGAVLLDYVRASKELFEWLEQNGGAPQSAIDEWGVAHATLCGNLNGCP